MSESGSFRGVNIRIGFLGALALLFITLKLTNHVNWSWWFVTSPLWVLPASFLILMVVSLVILLVGATIENMHNR